VAAEYFYFESLFLFDGAGVHLGEDVAEENTVVVFEELELLERSVELGGGERDSEGVLGCY
jgi:hypothetical protein